MWHPKCILLSGIPKVYTSLPDTRATIIHYFEDNNLSGGGLVSINGIQVTSCKKDVLVEFELCRDAAQVIKQQPHHIKIGDVNCELHVLQCPLAVYKKYYQQGQHGANSESSETGPTKKPWQEDNTDNLLPSFKTKLHTDVDKKFQHPTQKGAVFDCELCRTLVVEGITNELDIEDLELYFESEKKSGGGSLLAINFEENSGMVSLVFESALAVENILSRKEHMIDGHRLTVKPYQPPCREQDDAKAPITKILITGIKPGTSGEILQLLFENEKKSGGGEIQSFEMDKEGGASAVLVYVDDKVAVRVLAKKRVIFKGTKMTVTHLVEEAAAEQEELMWDKGTVYGTGLAAMSVNALAVESVLSKHKETSLLIDKCEITIQPLNNQTQAKTPLHRRSLKGENKKVASKTPDKTKETAKKPDSVVLNCLGVTGIKLGTPTEFEPMFFENNKKSGVGRIRSVNHNSEQGAAVITFKDEANAARALDEGTLTRSNGSVVKAAIPNQQQLKLLPTNQKNNTSQPNYSSYNKFERNSMSNKSISVSGLDETKQIWFEDDRRFGGRAIESLAIDRESTVANLTFKKDTVCSVKTTESSSRQKGKTCLRNGVMDMNQSQSTTVFSGVKDYVGSGAMPRFQHQLSEEPIQTEIDVNPDTMEYILLFFSEDLHGIAKAYGLLLDDSEAMEGRIKLMSFQGKQIPEDAIEYVRKYIQDLYVDVISTRVNIASMCHKLKNKWRDIIKCGIKYKAWIKEGDRDILIMANMYVIDVVVDEVNQILGIAQEIKKRERYVAQHSKSNLLGDSGHDANYQQSMQTPYSKSLIDQLPQIDINSLTQQDAEKYRLLRQRLMLADNRRSNFLMQESKMEVDGKSKRGRTNVSTPMKYKYKTQPEALVGNIMFLHGNVAYEDHQVPTFSQMSTTASLEPFSLENLHPYGSEYNEISEKFLTSRNFTEIRKIQRVQNPSLYQKFLLHKTHMDENNPVNTMNERRLWHGTGAETLAEINTNGFNRSFCGKNGTKYGKGVYFATDASTAVSYAKRNPCGERYIYYCRVLSGEFTQGHQNLCVPPAKDSIRPNIKYDSVVDNTVNPSMFVVFHDTQAFPQYLITFI